MTKTLTLRSLDIPGIHKFGIGFDSLFNDLERVLQVQSGSNYPPYNVIKTGEDTVTIELAVAGFQEGEIDINVNKSVLTIAGAAKSEEDAAWEYLHKGISSRDFRQNFALAEHVEVRSAIIRNGILRVNLERVVPEEARPKSIAITYQN